MGSSSLSLSRSLSQTHCKQWQSGPIDGEERTYENDLISCHLENSVAGLIPAVKEVQLVEGGRTSATLAVCGVTSAHNSAPFTGC